MKREIHKLPKNDIPADIHRKAEMLAGSLMRHSPMTQKNLKEKSCREEAALKIKAAN